METEAEKCAKRLEHKAQVHCKHIKRSLGLCCLRQVSHNQVKTESAFRDAVSALNHVALTVIFVGNVLLDLRFIRLRPAKSWARQSDAIFLTEIPVIFVAVDLIR